MAAKPAGGRPRKAEADKQSSNLMIRVRGTEKQAFQYCADLSGISLSSWLRERLRHAAIRDLEAAGKPIPFVDEIPIPFTK